MSTNETCIGQDALTTYLKKKNGKSSYRGFLDQHRDAVVSSSFSFLPKSWRDLDNAWAKNFIMEAKKIIDKETFVSLEKKVKRERSEKWLMLYWKGLIKEHEKENIPTSTKPKKKRFAEIEVLSVISQPIYYPDLEKSTLTTKSSSARTPNPVRSWTSFFEDVQSHRFNEMPKRYKKPKFRRYDGVDDISNEEDVRQALSVNILENLNSITVLRQPRERFKRISKEDHVKDEPDFIYKQYDKLLLAVEVKTSWVLELEVGESLHEKYEVDLKRKNSETIPPPNFGKEISVVNILRQIFGYLVFNNLQFGILLTYNQNWFLRRPKDEPRVLEIPLTIDVQIRNPTLFQCYAYIQSLSRTDTKCPSPGVTPHIITSGDINSKHFYRRKM